MAKATFGAGCFWGVEAAFQNIPGVTGTAAGYLGGTKDKPSYEDVCTGRTGHAEVLEIEFDPKLVSYETLLEVFWASHDPTTMNRQGPDRGTQYRSAIFFHEPEQEIVARRSLAQAQTQLPRPIVTEITPTSTFWKAEDYHQRYLEKRGLVSCDVPLKH